MPRCGVCLDFADKKASKVLAHGKTCVNPAWQRIEEARKEGLFDKANRIFRKLFGIGEPMSEEAKQKLKEYREAHAEEIKEKQQGKRMLRAALRRHVKQESAKLDRKRR
jgi:hypothetical protein